ncbi:hypothetical protein DSO57_1020645 [Entomophthora muscae]|uniref:Uncharacterized protein n=1 Tax=Entomophthora muscae TaxID=34485 RepID=A0ACC2RUT3_9FUNG|nr:hypothetical protein DSO57_1020645 [Entomophthora muscae]
MVGLIFALFFITFVSSKSPPYHPRRHGKVKLQRLNQLLKHGFDSSHKTPKEIVQTIAHYVPYSGLSYCPNDRVEVMMCGHCKNTKAKYFSFVTHNSSGTHAVILVNKERKEIVVSFRGSEDIFKIFHLITNDLDHFCINENGNMLVHKPVKEYLDYIINDMESKLSLLTKQHHGFDLVLAGHSLGGALATLAAPILYHKLHLNPSRLLVVSYGQPKVGNKVFVAYFESLDFPYIHVVNKNDLVPISPVSSSFSHIGNYIHIDKGSHIQCSKNEPEESRCFAKLLEVIDHSFVGKKIVGADGC